MKDKEIKVYLQRPWKFGDSSYYKNIIDFPPENIKYLNVKKGKELIQSANYFKLNNLVKGRIKKILRKIVPNLPNAHLTTSNEKYDLIHCTHCLSLNKTPWICDIEYVGQFWVSPLGDGTFPSKEKVKEIILSKNCKKIIAWNNWVRKEIIKLFPDVKDKIEILHFTMPIKEIKRKKSKRIKLLYTSRRFYFKGGLHSIEIIDRLTKKYKDVDGLIVSDTPKEIIEKYKGNKKIEFYELMPQKEMFKKIHPKSDIFVYPSYTDTYGFGLVEAQAFGIPVVTVEGQSRREIIQDGKTGFIISNKKNINYFNSIEQAKDIINEMQNKVELLIKDNKLRKKMGDAGINEVKNGKFSIEKRNDKLRKIYEEAIK